MDFRFNKLFFFSLFFFCASTVFSVTSNDAFTKTESGRLISSIMFFSCRVEECKDCHLLNELNKYKHLNKETKKRIFRALNQASFQTGLEKKLLFQLIHHESSFRPNIVSPAGAKGLTQLMPSTAAYFCGIKGKEIFDIEANMICGARYLSKLISDFEGDVSFALAAYNCGPTRVNGLRKKHNKDFHAAEKLMPSETQAYVSSIESSYFNMV